MVFGMLRGLVQRLNWLGDSKMGIYFQAYNGRAPVVGGDIHEKGGRRCKAALLFQFSYHFFGH